MALNLAPIVSDIWDGANPGNPQFLTVFNGELYFSANDGGGEGVELYKYDPTAEMAPVSRVADIWMGANSGNPSSLTVFNGELYFSADDGNGEGVELYKYDPTAETAPVSRVADIWMGANSGNPSSLTVFNGELYFSADDGNGEGVELYKYDGTDVTEVADIWMGANSGNPSSLTVFNGELYFSADDGNGEGVELYKYDPTAEADPVSRVADIWMGANSGNPSSLTVFNGELYFSADDGNGEGVELYKYDPTAETDPVTQVADINPGAGNSNPSNFAVFRGELYFQANNGENGTEVYKYSPDTNEATLVANINKLGNGNPRYLTVFDGELYLSADTGATGDPANVGQELYKLTPDPFDGRFGSAERAEIGDGDSYTPAQGWTSQSEFPRTLADVNGDGLADIIGFGASSVFVSLSEGDGSFGEANNVLEGFTPANGWTSQDQFPRTAGDVNGDGRADLIGFGQTSVFVSLSQEDGTFGDVNDVLDNFNPGNGWTNQDQFPRMVGDFDGDGNDDLIGFGQNAVFVSLSNGDGTFGAVDDVLENSFTSVDGWNSQDQYPRMVGDFNGDGRDDIIGFGFNDVRISFSQEDGTFGDAEVADIGGEGESNFTVNRGGWTSQNQYPRTVADIDGDGRDDIIGFGAESIYYALSEGDGSFGEAEILTLDGGDNFTVGSGGWTTQSLFPRFADDINGDSQADIVGFGGQSVFAALA